MYKNSFRKWGYRTFLVLAFVLMWKVAHASSLPEIGDREVVLQTIAMESSNQSARGMELVALAIINRSYIVHRVLNYGKRVYSISTYRENIPVGFSGKKIDHNKRMSIACRAKKQFSCWNDPKWARAWLGRHYNPKTRQNASNALEMACLGVGLDPNITHYHTKDVMPYWAKGHKPCLVVGSHKFYNDVK